jgi:hypothetical protein
MKITQDSIVSTLLLLLAGWYYLQARALPAGRSGDPGPAFLPTLLALSLAILGILLLIRSLKATVIVPPEEPNGRSSRTWRAWLTITLSVLYTVVFIPLGFALSTWLYTLALSLMFTRAREGWAIPLIAPFLTTGAIYFFFRIALGVRLPAGPFG